MALPRKNQVERQLYHLLANDTVTIPNILLRHYKELGLSDGEFISLITVLAAHPRGSQTINYSHIYEHLEYDEKYARKIISDLIKKELLLPLDDEENYCISPLYDKILEMLVFLKLDRTIAKQNKSKNKGSAKLVTFFEEGFARPLKQAEIDKIASWLQEKAYDPELIKEAFNRAILYDALSFAYIDKVLASFHKEGIMNAQDLFDAAQNKSEKKSQQNQAKTPAKTKRPAANKKSAPQPMVADNNDYNIILSKGGR